MQYTIFRYKGNFNADLLYLLNFDEIKYKDDVLELILPDKYTREVKSYGFVRDEVISLDDDRHLLEYINLCYPFLVGLKYKTIISEDIEEIKFKGAKFAKGMPNCVANDLKAMKISVNLLVYLSFFSWTKYKNVIDCVGDFVCDECANKSSCNAKSKTFGLSITTAKTDRDYYTLFYSTRENQTGTIKGRYYEVCKALKSRLGKSSQLVDKYIQNYVVSRASSFSGKVLMYCLNDDDRIMLTDIFKALDVSYFFTEDENINMIDFDVVFAYEGVDIQGVRIIHIAKKKEDVIYDFDVADIAHRLCSTHKFEWGRFTFQADGLYVDNVLCPISKEMTARLELLIKDRIPFINLPINIQQTILKNKFMEMIFTD